MATSLSAENIIKLDQNDMFALLRLYPKEINKARNLGESFELKDKFDELNEIIVIGMGGSAIGGDLLRCYLKDLCGIPVLVTRSYTLPKFVDHKTLVFACSFSGQTEETLNAVRALEDTGARVVCITSGGELASIACERDYSLVIVPNSRQPRTALCYLFLPMIVALDRLGLIPNQASAFDETEQVVAGLVRRCVTDDNLSKQLAHKLYQRMPLIYTSDTIEAVATRWKCQFSENSQILAYSNVLPEMNHNEIVGWDPSTVILDKIHVVLLRDRRELPRIKRRFEITKNISQKYTSALSEVYSEGTSLLARMFSLIVFGDFCSFYLAILNGVNPNAVKNIDFLKRELDKISL